MTSSSSFDERFETLAGLAYRVAYRLVGDRHIAENLAQEALARAYARWAKVHAYDEAWVTRVTTNLAIGHWRRNRPLPPDPSASASADDHVLERLDLAEALRNLPRRQRQVLALRFLADLSEAETARRLGCSTGSVKQHTHRGLRSMRSHLRTGDERPAAESQLRLDPTGGTEPC